MSSSGKHRCPVCGKTVFPACLSFEICQECGWEDDLMDPDDPEEFTGANPMELDEYRKAYQSGWRPEWLSREEDEPESGSEPEPEPESPPDEQ